MSKQSVYKLRARGLKNYKLDGMRYEKMIFYRLGNDAEDSKRRLDLEFQKKQISAETIEILEGGKPQ